MEPVLLSARQQKILNSIQTALSDPDIEIVDLQVNDTPPHLNWGATYAMTYWLCTQREFHSIVWLTTTQSQCKELAMGLERMRNQCDDTRVMERYDQRGRIDLRDANDEKWRFRFETNNQLRGIGSGVDLCIIDCAQPECEWLLMLAGGTKLLWLRGLPDGSEIAEEMSVKKIYL